MLRPCDVNGERFLKACQDVLDPILDGHWHATTLDAPNPGPLTIHAGMFFPMAASMEAVQRVADEYRRAGWKVTGNADVLTFDLPEPDAPLFEPPARLTTTADVEPAPAFPPRWGRVKVMAPPAVEFGIVSDANGELVVACKPPCADNWPGGIAPPKAGYNVIQPGFTAYVVTNKQD